MSHGTVHRYTLIAAGKLSIAPAPGRTGPSATSPHPRPGGCAATPVSQDQLDPDVGRPRLLTDQGKTRLVSVDARPPHGPLIPTGLELVLPPIELALPEPAPPAELPDGCPTPRRLADRPLPVTCFLSVSLSTVHLTPPPWIRLARFAHVVSKINCRGDYRAGSSSAEGGFTGRIRTCHPATQEPGNAAGNFGCFPSRWLGELLAEMR